MTRGASDFSTDDAKMLTRHRTLALVRQCPNLWSDGRLLLDWMELSAKKDPALGLLITQHALDPGRFIGVSREQEVIRFNREFFCDEVQGKRAFYIHNELGLELFDLDAFPRLGVLVFDGFTSIANVGLAEQLDLLFRFAHARARRNGQMLLVINTVQRPNRALKLDQGLLLYRNFLKERLGVVVSDKQLDRYQSEGRFFSMILHRLLFTTPGVPVPQPVQDEATVVVVSNP